MAEAEALREEVGAERGVTDFLKKGKKKEEKKPKDTEKHKL